MLEYLLGGDVASLLRACGYFEEEQTRQYTGEVSLPDLDRHSVRISTKKGKFAVELAS